MTTFRTRAMLAGMFVLIVIVVPAAASAVTATSIDPSRGVSASLSAGTRVVFTDDTTRTTIRCGTHSVSIPTTAFGGASVPIEAADNRYGSCVDSVAAGCTARPDARWTTAAVSLSVLQATYTSTFTITCVAAGRIVYHCSLDLNARTLMQYGFTQPIGGARTGTLTLNPRVGFNSAASTITVSTGSCPLGPVGSGPRVTVQELLSVDNLRLT
ncbi:MAG TPA: hypothetical protein VI111_09195 [Thermoleophilaceae bacterium]